MTKLLEWLLDLERIRIDRDAPLSVRWEHGWPAWALLAAGIATMLIIGAIYRRERGSAVRRVSLAAIRCGLVAVVVAVLCRPTLVLQHNRVEPSHIALLIDASASMAARDAYVDEALVAVIAAGAGLSPDENLAEQTRIELITRAFARDDAAALRALLARNGAALYTFAGDVRSEVFVEKAAGVRSLVDAMAAIIPDGGRTDLAGAIRSAIDRAGDRRLAAIVLVSDGRSTESADLSAVIDAARNRQIPIIPVMIGSPVPRRSIRVGPLRAQQTVFAGDLLAIEARIEAVGLTEPMQVSAVLLDDRSGMILSTETVTINPDPGIAVVELRTKPTRAGDFRYRVQVAPLPGELQTDDNVDRIDVTVLEDQLHVLYVEGYPRFEYRYLKNALLRERTMRFSVLLLEADPQFVQEGTDPIRRFPETPEELNQYDVVLMGDVDPRAGWLSQSQMIMLLDFVGHEGGGFALIAGERSTPHRFLGTPLEKLIPVRIDPARVGRSTGALTTGYRPVLTPEGRASRIFRLDEDVSKTQDRYDALPDLYWFAQTAGPKPGATVLAEHPTATTISGPMPLMVAGRYGAGKVFFQATDDIWRWRRHSGELLVDTYWIQVVRSLMQTQRIARDRRYAVRCDRREYAFGRSIRTEVEFFDPDLLAEQGDKIDLVLSDADDLLVARFEAQRVGPGSTRFEGLLIPPRVGRFSVKAASIAPRPGERTPSALVRIERPMLEAKRLDADYETMQRIAESTGGSTVRLDELAEAFARIQPRPRETPDDITEPLWDSKLVLLIFVLMISMEWILRKAFGMM